MTRTLFHPAAPRPVGASRRRGGLVIALVVTLLASTVVVSSATEEPAAADLGAVNIVMNRPGTTARYGPNEVVTIEAGNMNFVGNCSAGLPGSLPNRQTAGVPDWFQPWADIYVVPSGYQIANNSPLTDVGGAHNAVFGGLGGSFVFEQLGMTYPRGNLPAGVYGIVVDECQNGVFDTGEDTYVEDVFWVDLDDDVPPLSREAILFQATKRRAGDLSGALGAVEELLAFKEALDKLKKLQEVAAASMSVEAFSVFVISQGVAAIQAASPYAVLQNRAQDITKQTIKQVRSRYELLHKDPPDTAYQLLPVPVATGAWFSESDLPFEADMQAYVAQLDALSALTGAILNGVERYQGADAAGNARWAYRQGQATKDLIALYQAQIDDLVAADATLQATLQATWDAGIFDFAHSVRTMAQGVDHFTSATVSTNRVARNSGLDLDQARAVATEFDAATPDLAPDHIDDWRGAFTDARIGFEEFSASLDGLVTEIDGLQAQIETAAGDAVDDPTVGIGVTGTPSPGSEVELGLTGIDDIGGAAVDWDLNGDGLVVDAQGPTATWTVPANAMVGAPLVVSATISAGAIQKVASAIVTVAPGGNRPPAITALDRNLREIAPGVSTDFEVEATDADGDPLSYAWVVDGVIQDGASGPTFSLTTTPDDFGPRWVEVHVTDGKAVRISNWLARVITPDADNDGYRAAPGPDCMDTPVAGAPLVPQLVSPANPERPNNGLDDDCDPATPDDGSGNVGSISLHGLNNAYGSAGDVVGPTSVSWTHPQRYSTAFRLTLDWGDGSEPHTEVVEGVDFFETQFQVPSHQYPTERMPYLATGCIEVVETGYTMCDDYVVYIVNDRPMVNGADLRTWGPVEHTEFFGVSNLAGDLVPLDPDGRKVASASNPNNPHVLPSPTELPEDGYGRASLSAQMPPGDDDSIGMVFGYQPGDITPAAADDDEFVAVSWSNAGGTAYVPNYCNDGPVTSLASPGALISWRNRGAPANYLEYFTVSTVNYPYDPTDDVAQNEPPQHPSCSDELGPELLTQMQNPPSDLVGSKPWKPLASTPLQRRSAGYATEPYLIEFDYQPESLTVWVDGVLQFEATADPSDPFPPGGVGIYYGSQPNARFAATAPEPTFEFVQGKGGLFGERGPDANPVAPDGIAVPMHDNPGDSHTAVIEWGDGTSASAGVITPDPATGAGWWTIGADHVYERAGTFRGEVCATDSLGLGSCFPFTAVVENVAPTVDAGPDRETGAEVALDDMTFQDPGAFDAHTATIDWGDGEGAQPATVLAARGGEVPGEHTYADDGTYTVELCVTDQDEATTCDERVVEVRATPVAPVAQITDGVVVPEGSTAEVGVGFTDENPDDVHGATIDWGDGSAPEPVLLQDGGSFGSGSGAHVYGDDGTYTVTVEICDAELCDEATTTIEVTNVGPVVDAQSTVSEGGVELIGLIADPGVDDTHTATVDWGDGDAPETVAVDTSGAVPTVTATHQYRSPGPRTIEVCVTDDDDGTGCDQVEVEITELSGTPPLLSVVTPEPVVEGDTVTLTGMVEDPDDGDTAEVTVDWGDGSTPAVDTADPDTGLWSVDHVYGDDAEPVGFTVVVEACDSTDRCERAQTTAVVTNATPEVDAGRDRVGSFAVVLDDTTFTDAGVDDTHTATVDWGAGSGAVTAAVTGHGGTGTVQASHTYAELGAYVVEVCVTDDDGASSCDTFDVEVAPSPVEVGLAAEATVPEGSLLTVPFTFADPDGGTHTATVRWSDGSGEESVSVTESTDEAGTTGSGSTSHTYADDGVFTATVEVCAVGSDACGTASIVVTVTNVAPVLGTAEVATTDDVVVMSVPFTDVGVDDTHTATIDWGDGVGPVPASVDPEAGEAWGLHAYGSAGVRAVQVCVTDDGGGTTCVAFDVTVGDPPNVVPELVLDTPASVGEGSPVALVGRVTDPDDDTFTLTVEWGDGTTTEHQVGSTFSVPHTYVDQGRSTIRATITDGEGDDTAIVQVDVVNVAPSVTVDPSVDDLDVELAIGITDPGSDDVLSATIDWGDGTVETVPGDAAPAFLASAVTAEFLVAHRYAEAGTFGVEVCARDTDGGRTCTDLELVVGELDLTPPPEPGPEPGPDPDPLDAGAPPPDSPGPGGRAGAGEVEGESAGRTPAVPVTAGGSSLPYTGGVVGPLMVLAAALLAAGALVVGGSWLRRRRSA